MDELTEPGSALGAGPLRGFKDFYQYAATTRIATSQWSYRTALRTLVVLLFLQQPNPFRNLVPNDFVNCLA